VIVRISSDGQYELDDAHHGRLDELDDLVVAAVERSDEAGYRAAFDELLQFVRSEGATVGDDDLRPSDIILPPEDLSYAEAGEEFTGEGLVPDPPEAATQTT
jgi:hypothetical protein